MSYSAYSTPAGTPAASMAGEGDQPEFKRKRSSRACATCRNKKVRCSGTNPCRHCIEFGEECSFEDPSSTQTKGFQNLQLRMTRLERYLRSNGIVLPPLPNSGAGGGNGAGSSNSLGFNDGNGNEEDGSGERIVPYGLVGGNTGVGSGSFMTGSAIDREIKQNARSRRKNVSLNASTSSVVAFDDAGEMRLDNYGPNAFNGNTQSEGRASRSGANRPPRSIAASTSTEGETVADPPEEFVRPLPPSETAQELRPDKRGNLRYLGPASTSSVVAELSDRQRWDNPSNIGNYNETGSEGVNDNPISKPWGIFQNLGITIAGALPPLAKVDLPDEDLSAVLLESFFDVLNPIFPVLHRTTFMADYHKMRSAPIARADPTFLSCLLAAFACGSLIIPSDPRVHAEGGYCAEDCPRPASPRKGQGQGQENEQGQSGGQSSERMSYNFGLADSVRKKGVERPGHRFYAQCNITLLHSLAQPCIEQVILYGLLAFFHVASGAVARAWLLCGNALRIAIELGLHRSSAYFEPYIRERRRRVFWALYSMEGVLAANLGRPTSLPDDEIDQELPINLNLDSLLAERNGAPDSGREERAELTGFLHLLVLHRLAADALRTITKHQRAHNRKSLDELKPKLLLYESSLQRWFADIPAALNEEFHTLTATERAQKHIMTSLYPSVYMLIFLPLLPQKGVSPTEFQVYSLSRVVMASKDLICIASPIAQTVPPSHYLFDFTQHLLVAGALLLLLCHRGLEDPSVMGKTMEEVEKGIEGLAELGTVFVGGQAGHQMLVAFRDNMKRQSLREESSNGASRKNVNAKRADAVAGSPAKRRKTRQGGKQDDMQSILGREGGDNSHAVPSSQASAPAELPTQSTPRQASGVVHALSDPAMAEEDGFRLTPEAGSAILPIVAPMSAPSSTTVSRTGPFVHADPGFRNSPSSIHNHTPAPGPMLVGAGDPGFSSGAFAPVNRHLVHPQPQKMYPAPMSAQDYYIPTRASMSRQSLPFNYPPNHAAEQVVPMVGQGRMSMDSQLYSMPQANTLGLHEMQYRQQQQQQHEQMLQAEHAQLGMGGSTDGMHRFGMPGLPAHWPSDHLNFDFTGLDELATTSASTFGMTSLQQEGDGSMRTSDGQGTSAQEMVAGYSAMVQPMYDLRALNPPKAGPAPHPLVDDSSAPAPPSSSSSRISRAFGDDFVPYGARQGAEGLEGIAPVWSGNP